VQTARDCDIGAGMNALRRCAAPALLLLAIALPALPAAAQSPAIGPEPVESLLARTPALELATPIAPLAAPLPLGGAGWGPFRRLCVTRHLIQPDGNEVLETEPSCFTVARAVPRGETWDLSLLSDPLRGGPRIAFATTRDAAGTVGEVAVTPPEGQPPPPPAMLARLRTIFRLMIEAHASTRRTIAPNEPFLLPLALTAIDPDTTSEEGGFACTPDGTATLRARPVLVATCRTTARTNIGDGAISRIDIAGRFAIDIETGLILRHRYASFLFMEQDPKKFMPNLRWRGISRQDLE
jgi:hypothetical protein